MTQTDTINQRSDTANGARSTVRILCPTGHLGFAPLRPESFRLGETEHPDYIVADSGSCDVGPAPLALDEPASPLSWQRFDLSEMLLAARRLDIPMVIGSAADAGTNAGVDRYVRLIRNIAAEHHLAPFTLGYFYSEVPVSTIGDRLARGESLPGLDGRAALTQRSLDRTDRIVAVAGVHPYLDLLRRGADVVIGGRSSDAALFAAPSLLAGADAGSAYCLGKLLECASFCAEPYGAKESVMGSIVGTDVLMTAMNPAQRCTIASVAGHAMYERSNPYSEHVLGGHLDLSGCRYEQFDDRTCRVAGASFEPADPLMVKLEGAGRVGERYIGIAGIRDPYTIRHIDRVIDWVRSQVAADSSGDRGRLFFHVYGRDAVMHRREPTPQPHHEIAVVIEAVAEDEATAKDVCMTALRQLFYARLPDVKGTAGSAAFLIDEALRATPGCEWTVNHTMSVSDPLELFPRHLTTVRG